MSNPLIDTIYKTLSGNEATKVTSDIKELRLKKCNSCTTPSGEKMVTMTGNCRECLCFVNLKTEYLEEECPLNKW